MQFPLRVSTPFSINFLSWLSLHMVSKKIWCINFPRTKSGQLSSNYSTPSSWSSWRKGYLAFPNFKETLSYPSHCEFSRVIEQSLTMLSPSTSNHPGYNPADLRGLQMSILLMWCPFHSSTLGYVSLSQAALRPRPGRPEDRLISKDRGKEASKNLFYFCVLCHKVSYNIIAYIPIYIRSL